MEIAFLQSDASHLPFRLVVHYSDITVGGDSDRLDSRPTTAPSGNGG